MDKTNRDPLWEKDPPEFHSTFIGEDSVMEIPDEITLVDLDITQVCTKNPAMNQPECMKNISIKKEASWILDHEASHDMVFDMPSIGVSLVADGDIEESKGEVIEKGKGEDVGEDKDGDLGVGSDGDLKEDISISEEDKKPKCFYNIKKSISMLEEELQKENEIEIKAIKGDSKGFLASVKEESFECKKEDVEIKKQNESSVEIEVENKNDISFDYAEPKAYDAKQSLSLETSTLLSEEENLPELKTESVAEIQNCNETVMEVVRVDCAPANIQDTKNSSEIEGVIDKRPASQIDTTPDELLECLELDQENLTIDSIEDRYDKTSVPQKNSTNNDSKKNGKELENASGNVTVIKVVQKTPEKQEIENNLKIQTDEVKDDNFIEKQVENPKLEENISVEDDPSKTVCNDIKNKSGDEMQHNERCIWIFNINPSTTAGRIKIELSKYAKVLTAKIVTNGEKYYGYALLDTKDEVNLCIEKLNNRKINGYVVEMSTEGPQKKKPPKKEKAKGKSTKPPKPTRKRSRSVDDPLTLKVDSKTKKSKPDEQKRRSHSRSQQRHEYRAEELRFKHQREIEIQIENEKRKLEQDKRRFEREKMEFHKMQKRADEEKRRRDEELRRREEEQRRREVEKRRREEENNKRREENRRREEENRRREEENRRREENKRREENRRREENKRREESRRREENRHREVENRQREERQKEEEIKRKQFQEREVRCTKSSSLKRNTNSSKWQRSISPPKERNVIESKIEIRHQSRSKDIERTRSASLKRDKACYRREQQSRLAPPPPPRLTNEDLSRGKIEPWKSYEPRKGKSEQFNRNKNELSLEQNARAFHLTDYNSDRRRYEEPNYRRKFDDYKYSKFDQKYKENKKRQQEETAPKPVNCRSEIYPAPARNAIYACNNNLPDLQRRFDVSYPVQYNRNNYDYQAQQPQQHVNQQPLQTNWNPRPAYNTKDFEIPASQLPRYDEFENRPPYFRKYYGNN